MYLSESQSRRRIMMLYHSLRYCHQYKIDDDGRDEAGDGIDEIMRLNIYGSQTQEDVEWQHHV